MRVGTPQLLLHQAKGCTERAVPAIGSLAAATKGTLASSPLAVRFARRQTDADCLVLVIKRNFTV